MPEKKPKIRNYSFQQSKRLPESKMTEVNGVTIPSMAGSCYHAIMCALANYKNKLVHWNKIIELTEKYMCQYGGRLTWEKFKTKDGVKTYEQRIKDNTHTLTRRGKDCYGYRLHERGMGMYFFKDGAMLLTGGTMTKDGDSYDVIFPDGRGLQMRYRGTSMTYREYGRFFELKYIDKNGRIIDAEAIRKFRSSRSNFTHIHDEGDWLQVCVSFAATTTQETVDRLESLGLIVEEALGNEAIGRILRDKLEALQADKDVASVDVAG